ncbi:MAG: HDOD domain-containing protein [Candidatus Cloacimonetes bacterium]|nr:HDOD domain-containing protein [Candidatus Cloacimonadota bacterium]
MLSILFFEPDKKDQKRFKKMFAKVSSQYRITFCDSQEAMYAELRKNFFDILIVNIHDTGLSGLDLISRLGKQYPDMIRVVLSDTEDQMLMLRASVVAHQYISKPYDLNTICQAIKRFTRVRELMGNSNLSKLISQMKNLPTPPVIYTQLMRKLKEDDISLSEIGKMIEQDIGMSAEILRVVNSAQFGVRKKVISPTQAVTLLGINMVKDLMLSTHLFSQYEEKPFLGISYKSIWNHGMSTAGICRKISSSEKLGNETTNAAFISGLLHGIGVLVLASEFPETYFETVMRAEKEDIPLQESEYIDFKASHFEVGAYLMGHWGLADSIVEAIAYHQNIQAVAMEYITPTVVVHASNAIDFANHPHWCYGKKPEIDWDILNHYNLSKTIKKWQKLVSR